MKSDKKSGILLSLEIQQWKQKKYDVSHVLHKGICKEITNAYPTSTSMMKTYTKHAEGCMKFITVAEIVCLHT